MRPKASDPVALAERLGPTERLLVVVDHDGTISPIAPTPEAAVLADGAAEAIARLSGRAPVVVLSGRTLDDLAHRFDGLDVVLVADHGATVRARDGTVVRHVDPARVAGALEAARTAVTALIGDGSGWRIEPKDVSLAVHHRLVAPDEAAARLPGVRAVMAAAADAEGLELLDGKAVTELRARGADKGSALRVLAAEHPGRVPLVLGDDRTDEDAFAVAVALGGHAVLVGDHGGPTHAAFGLRDPDDAVALLAALAGSSG